MTGFLPYVKRAYTITDLHFLQERGRRGESGGKPPISILL